MMYHAITKDDMKNGDGLRVVLWVAGCEHMCEHCHNPQTWHHDRGEPFTEWAEAELFSALSKDHISGITFSGGDPLHPANRDEVGRLASKAHRMGKDVWLYTGYRLTETADGFIFADYIKNLPTFFIPWMDCIDVIVDGRYIQSVRDNDIYLGHDPHWCGSSNQRIIDVPRSIERGVVVELYQAVVSSRRSDYSDCIRNYRNYDLNLIDEKEMLALLNILEAHGETLSSLLSAPSAKIGGFCDLYYENFIRTAAELANCVMDTNHFFSNLEDFTAFYREQYPDVVIEKLADELLTKVTDGYVWKNVC